jgi:TonB-linked SusC/RagA family outer membrane protein
MATSKQTIKIALFIPLFSIAFSNLWSQVSPPVKGKIVPTERTMDSALLRKAKALENAVAVTGSITEAASGKPLPGISIRYKDFSAAITDSLGMFSLKVPDYKTTVTIDGSGYQSKEIPLRGQSSIATALFEDSYNSYFDLAALPFGNKPKSRIPFAVNSVQTNGAWNRSFETPDSYLQGKVAGLNSIRRSGTPNIGANLFLRGYNSLYGTNQPLIVVDGVIFDNTEYGNSLISNNYTNPLAFIDVKDIDNFTVLKDGSSIYGTKGANGVIIITTARAKELATRIDFAAYGGINFAPSKLPVLNATDYRLYLSQLLQTTGLTNDQIQAYPYMNDNPSNPDYYRYHNNTDWQKEVLSNSYAQHMYLKVTGGDNIAKYALSLGYLKNEGVIKSNDLSRYNMRFNADLNLSKRLTALANLSYTFNEQNLRDQGLAIKTNPLFLALTKSPILSVREVSSTGIESPDLAGRDTFNISNPLALINNSLGVNQNYRFFGSMAFNYSLFKSISLHTTVGITMDKVRENSFIPSKGVATDTLSLGIANNRSGTQAKRLFNIFNESRISYNATFNHIHQLTANLGFRYIQSKTEQDFGQGFNSATDELKSVSFGLSTLRRIGGNIGEWRWINNYFNADYNLLDKYFLSFNVAADGSSRFGDDINAGAISLGSKKFAVMPSIAGAWLVSSEDFMRNASFFDLLKLRASFGLSGNDDIGNYAARQFYVSQNLLGVQGLVRGNFGNSQLQWEKVSKVNVGTDISLFNERFNLSLDVYNNRTSKMLINQPTAAQTGLLYAVTNSGGMKTSGVEATLSTRIINKSRLKWDVGVTVAKSASKITELPIAEIKTEFGGATMVTRMGSEPNLFYGFKTNGIYTTNADAVQDGYSVKTTNGTLLPFKGGDVRFMDINGDKIIDDADRQVIGNPNADVFGSLNSRLEWKQFSLEALFTFSKGNDIYNYLRNQLEAGSGYSNGTTALINSWKNNGDVTTIPKVAFGDPMGNSRFSDRWIEDGSYLRLRNLTFSYNLPFKSGFLKYSVVYLTGNNVFTLTKYLGYDPEFSAGESVFAQGIDLALEPQHRSVQIGLRFGL